MDMSAVLVRQIAYPLWVRRNRSPRLRYVAEFERSQYRSPDEVRARQWADFKSVVGHAARACPFYRRKFAEARFAPDDLRSPDDVVRVPTTTKQEIQEHLAEMFADGLHRRDLVRDMTGGSTGSPLVVYYDSERFERRVAATIRHNRWAGWNLGDKVASLWGAPRDMRKLASFNARLRNAVIDRQLILDASAIDDAAMARFARRLLRFRPAALLGYANMLALFARFVSAAGIDGIRPRGIVSSAELLTPENRAVIESAFGCRVFDRYGSRELGIIASECEVHRGMHVNAEDLFVETLPAVDGGAAGEIVITDLRNYVMPMIRYRTMDVGRLIAGACPCGRGLPLLEMVGGRTTDFLVATSGKRVSGVVLATYVITNIAGVQQVQFVQQRREAVTVRIVRGPAWSEQSLQELLARLHRFLGAAMELDVVYRPELPLQASGKLRFSISTVSGDGGATVALPE